MSEPEPIEIAGPHELDGAWLDIPPGHDALVLIRPDGRAVLAKRRGTTLDDATIAEQLLDLALRIAPRDEPQAPHSKRP